MATTFGDQIKQLVLSTDIIDDHLLDQITELIEKYMMKSLNIQNAKVMISDLVDGEGGLFHGRTEWTAAVPTLWIPVREKDSPLTPFDFAQERILLVDRNKDGSLKRNVFANRFRERVEAMLSAS